VASNAERSGGPFDPGLANATPGMTYHTPILRFGGVCSDGVTHFLQSFERLFRALFVAQPSEGPPWITQCHFDLEVRPPEWAAYAKDAFLGPVVFVVLAAILVSLVARRERRLAAYAPVGFVAALVLVYTKVGAGFAWRYVGDFWPVIVLACVEYVRLLPASAGRWLDGRLAVVFVCAAALTYLREVPPQPPAEMLKPSEVARMFSEFEGTRFRMDPTLPSRLACAEPVDWPLHNMIGWSVGGGGGPSRCGVDTFTNVYLGVPTGGDRHRQIRFEVDHADAAPRRVYVNGRVYRTHTEGDAYVVDADVDVTRLVSPVVQVTIEWVPVTEPAPPIRLKAVQLS
jgi:hypothetical protein